MEDKEPIQPDLKGHQTPVPIPPRIRPWGQYETSLLVALAAVNLFAFVIAFSEESRYVDFKGTKLDARQIAVLEYKYAHSREYVVADSVRLSRESLFMEAVVINLLLLMALGVVRWRGAAAARAAKV